MEYEDLVNGGGLTYAHSPLLGDGGDSEEDNDDSHRATHILSAREFQQIYLGQHQPPQRQPRHTAAANGRSSSQRRGARDAAQARATPSPHVGAATGGRSDARAYDPAAWGSSSPPEEEEGTRRATPRRQQPQSTRRFLDNPIARVYGVRYPARRGTPTSHPHRPSPQESASAVRPASGSSKAPKRLRATVKAFRRSRSPQANATDGARGDRSEYRWLSMSRELQDTKLSVRALEKALLRAQVTIRGLYGAGYGELQEDEASEQVSLPPNVTAGEGEGATVAAAAAPAAAEDRDRLAKRVCFLEEKLAAAEVELAAVAQNTRAARVKQLMEELSAAEEVIACLGGGHGGTPPSRMLEQLRGRDGDGEGLVVSSASPMEQAGPSSPLPDNAEQATGEAVEDPSAALDSAEQAPQRDDAPAATDLETTKKLIQAKAKARKLKGQYAAAQAEAMQATVLISDLSAERTALMKELEAYSGMPQTIRTLEEQLEEVRGNFMATDRKLQQYKQVFDRFSSPAAVEAVIAERDHLLELLREKGETETALRGEVARVKEVTEAAVEERVRGAFERERELASDRVREMERTISELEADKQRLENALADQANELQGRIAEMLMESEQDLVGQLLVGAPSRQSGASSLRQSPAKETALNGASRAEWGGGVKDAPSPSQGAAASAESLSPYGGNLSNSSLGRGPQNGPLPTGGAAPAVSALSEESETALPSSSVSSSSSPTSSAPSSVAPSSDVTVEDAAVSSIADHASHVSVVESVHSSHHEDGGLAATLTEEEVVDVDVATAESVVLDPSAGATSIIKAEKEAMEHQEAEEEELETEEAPTSTSQSSSSPETTDESPSSDTSPSPASAPAVKPFTTAVPGNKAAPTVGFSFPRSPMALPPPPSILVRRGSTEGPQFSHARVQVRSPTPSGSGDGSSTSASYTNTGGSTSGTGDTSQSPSSNITSSSSPSAQTISPDIFKEHPLADTMRPIGSTTSDGAGGIVSRMAPPPAPPAAYASSASIPAPIPAVVPTAPSASSAIPAPIPAAVPTAPPTASNVPAPIPATVPSPPTTAASGIPAPIPATVPAAPATTGVPAPIPAVVPTAPVASGIPAPIPAVVPAAPAASGIPAPIPATVPTAPAASGVPAPIPASVPTPPAASGVPAPVPAVVPAAPAASLVPAPIPAVVPTAPATAAGEDARVLSTHNESTAAEEHKTSLSREDSTFPGNRQVSNRAIPSPPTTNPVLLSSVSPIPVGAIMPIFTSEEHAGMARNTTEDSWDTTRQYSGNASFDFVGGLAERRRMEEAAARAEGSVGSHGNMITPKGSPASNAFLTSVAAATGSQTFRPAPTPLPSSLNGGPSRPPAPGVAGESPNPSSDGSFPAGERPEHSPKDQVNMYTPSPSAVRADDSLPPDEKSETPSRPALSTAVEEEEEEEKDAEAAAEVNVLRPDEEQLGGERPEASGQRVQHGKSSSPSSLSEIGSLSPIQEPTLSGALAASGEDMILSNDARVATTGGSATDKSDRPCSSPREGGDSEVDTSPIGGKAADGSSRYGPDAPSTNSNVSGL